MQASQASEVTLRSPWKLISSISSLLLQISPLPVLRSAMWGAQPVTGATLMEGVSLAKQTSVSWLSHPLRSHPVCSPPTSLC